MGFQSQDGQVGFKTQGPKGLFKGPGSAGPAVNEIQTITRTSTAGTFLLTVMGATTGAITAAAAVTAANIQAAIDALDIPEPEDIVVAGDPGGPFTLTYTGFYAGTNVPAGVITDSGTGGTVEIAQTTAGVPGPGVFARIKSGSLSANRELLIPDAEIGGNRDIPDAVLGAVAFSGEYELYPRSQVALTLLNAALGATTSDASAGPNEEAIVHEITPIDNGALPWLSIEEAIGDDFEVFNYTDAKVNSLHFEADANGYITCSVGLVALTQTGGNTRTVAPEWDLTPLMVGSKVTVTYKGVALPAKSFSLDIANNLEDDDFRLGSVFLGDITEKRRELTGGFTVRPENKDLWRASTYGSAAATTPTAGAADKGEVVITITSYENIAGTVLPFKFEFTVPEAAIKPFEIGPSGDDVIEHDMELQFLRPDPDVPILTVELTNDLAAVA